jgi:hypothetical protein
MGWAHLENSPALRGAKLVFGSLVPPIMAFEEIPDAGNWVKLPGFLDLFD